MNTSEWIATLALLGSMVGIGMLFLQIKQASDTAKITLLFSINRDLNTYSDVAILIESNSTDDWVFSLNKIDRERLLDYISYFEGIQLSIERNLFNLSEIDAYFSNRFFRMVNNMGMRKCIFLNSDTYNDAFRPIFMLQENLSRYRERMGLPKLFVTSPSKAAIEISSL